ncbi:restriction endonuclease subunit S [Dehalococcoides sp.]|uniref:restriction endonuclease subunit S n=1 Tax=Dehalococcoides sp. TaxID=1966486 RepID=UPI002ACB08E0|nr:restriction endonuclease subunit S [Dehalococcoides sp.]
MEIKTGYKKTDVGIIPQDWDVKVVGDLFDVSGGFSTSRSHLSNEGNCYLHYGDIHGSEKQYIDVENEYLSIPKLNVDLKRISPTSLLTDGDIVFVDASEDDEGASKHVVIRNPKAIPFISGLHTIVLKSKDDSIANPYKEYCFLTHNIRRQFKFYAVGTKVTGISKTNIKKIKVVLPREKAEQSSIAEALADADALIASLEKLLAKKKNIKQGAMQLLLTGKKRLPGFSGEWENKQLSEVVDVYGGGTPSTANKEFWDGNIHWCTPTDITALKGSKYLFDTERKITSIGLKNIAAEILPINSVIMTSRATIGECAINKVPVSTNQGFKSLVPKTIDFEFLYYKILTQKSKLIKLGSGSTFFEVSKKDIEKLNLYIPALPQEQAAIAQILSDMDMEIEELERTLAKYQLLKQGMMQELLTGKKRLI